MTGRKQNFCPPLREEPFPFRKGIKGEGVCLTLRWEFRARFLHPSLRAAGGGTLTFRLSLVGKEGDKTPRAVSHSLLLADCCLSSAAQIVTPNRISHDGLAKRAASRHLGVGTRRARARQQPEEGSLLLLCACHRASEVPSLHTASKRLL